MVLLEPWWDAIETLLGRYWDAVYIINRVFAMIIDYSYPCIASVQNVSPFKLEKIKLIAQWIIASLNSGRALALYIADALYM